MATDNCKQVNIPTTDNTPLDCDPYILDKCVIVPEGNSFILTNDNGNLEEYHEKLIEKLIVQNQRIIVLENSSPGLVTYELALAGTTLNLSVNGSIVTSVSLAALTTAGLTETKERFVSTGGETTLTTAHPINTSVPNQFVIEGVVMSEGISNDYTVSGSTITLATPLTTGDVAQIFYKY